MSTPGSASEHFVSGQKSNDPRSPDYVPSIFSHVSSIAKRKQAEDLHRHERLDAEKRKKDKLLLADGRFALFEESNGVQYCKVCTTQQI